MSGNSKYGVGYKVSGVYKITNNITGDFYIGSSVKVVNRLSNHFNREIKKYPTKPLYMDILHYGFENFTVEILEECNREQLINRELYYYDKLKPTYNIIKPTENNFKNPELRELALIGTVKHHNLKEKYNCDKYRNIFRTMHKTRMKPVEMIKNETMVHEFISIRAAARWCDENTAFTSKNKASKIKAVCDGERKSAFNFKWRYKKV